MCIFFKSLTIRRFQTLYIKKVYIRKFLSTSIWDVFWHYFINFVFTSSIFYQLFHFFNLFIKSFVSHVSTSEAESYLTSNQTNPPRTNKHFKLFRAIQLPRHRYDFCYRIVLNVWIPQILTISGVNFFIRSEIPAGIFCLVSGVNSYCQISRHKNFSRLKNIPALMKF